jgi:hypothetical protein
MKTGGSLRDFEIPRTSGSFVFKDFQIPITSWFLWIFLDTQKLMVVWKFKELPNTGLFRSVTNFLTTYSSHLIMFSIFFNSHLNTLNSTKNGPCRYLLACLMVHSHLMWNQC